MRQTDGNSDDGLQQRRRLEEMQIQFVSIRPKGRIRIVVQADGGRPVSRQFGKGENVHWNDIMMAQFSFSLVVSIWRRPWYIYRRLVARFNLAADDCGPTTTELTDTKGRLKLSLRFTNASSNMLRCPGSHAIMVDKPASTSVGSPVPSMSAEEAASQPFISNTIANRVVPPPVISPTDATGAHLHSVALVEDTERHREQLKQQILDVRPTVKEKKFILEKLGKVRGLIGYIDTIGDALGNAHPIAGAAFSALGMFIKACEKQEHCREAALDLLDQLDDFMKIGASVPELDGRVKSVQPVQDMLRLIDDIVGYVRKHTKGDYSADLWSNTYFEKISAFKIDFSKAYASFQGILQTEVFKGLDCLQQEAQLKSLRPSVDAHFRSSKGTFCLENTRIDLLERLHLWSEASIASPSPSFVLPSSPLHWLYGAAGTGKSTVAKTFARQEELRGSALLCFFCRRDNVDLATTSRLLPTLAYVLAKQHAGYARAVLKVLSDPKYISIASAEVSEQFEVLFKNTLPTLTPPAGLFIGVVDAVDECGDAVEQGATATHLRQLATLVPWLKFFVTSRREPKISEALKSADCIMTNIEDESSTPDDIRRYITHELFSLSLAPEIIEALVRRAAGLFVWCSTLLKFVLRSADPKARINQVLATSTAPAATKGVYKELYKLYDDILRLAVQVEEDGPLAKDVLGLVLISSETRLLTCAAMAYFLDVSLSAVETVVDWMHAVLHRGENDVVRVYHNSFRDYLELTLDAAQVGRLHSVMANASLAVMLRDLRFNICDFEGKPRLNRDIANLQSLVNERLSFPLQYASLFWFHHLSKSGPPSKNLEDQVVRLVCDVRVFFYLEVLSVLDALEIGARILFECVRHFKNRFDIITAAGDVERFVSSYSEAMKSVPHIYLSAASWAPSASWISRKLTPHFRHLPSISTHNDAFWDSCISVRSMGSEVHSVAYCPDGSRFVTGLDDGTLRIADARTGAPVGEPLRGHTYIVLSVAYSRDGMRIASGSIDKTVRLWDAHTGAPVGEPFHGHSNYVRSVAFSPDGTRLVSGSDDETLRIWEVPSGTPVGQPLRGHSGRVCSVMYSPDGAHIVSGSWDNTIRIWDAQSRAPVGDPLEGHSGGVNHVAYSSGGSRLVSASEDRTLRIWDADSGALIGDPLRGHESHIICATYSPDGALIASCGSDNSVRLWDARSCAPLALFRGHSSTVNSVAFSPDSPRLISGSDNTMVRIWNTSARTAISVSAECHSENVYSVAYSADGRRIISGSGDGTVRVWDARSGAPVGEPFRGHSDKVNSVAISPDGTRVVSGSSDNTVRIWDADSGQPVGSPLQGHTHSITCVAYSHDGTRIASSSLDKTIRIWDAFSGKLVTNPLQGHSGYVRSVVYSPDSRHILSGSDDRTVRVWNAHAGTPIGKPMTGHSDWVRAVAYSPDGTRLVSASDDKTLRIWDATSDACISSVAQAHPSLMLSVAYHPDGTHIISGGSDGTVRVWSATTGEPIGEPLQAHSDWVRSVAYSPDGTRILSGSNDKTIRISGGRPPADERWQRCLSSLDEQDGWVRDGEEILFWVPHKYRARLRSRNTIVIGEEIKRETPVVDMGKVWRYVGEEWTEIYKGRSG